MVMPTALPGPSRIMIIRHAEKPAQKGHAPFGVDAAGEHHHESLTVVGWQRAGALVALFAPARGEPRDPNLARPDLIYAAAPSHHGGADGSRSRRPVQTIEPLAARLGLIPEVRHAKGDEAALVKDVLPRGGNVLISWQHAVIPKIARLIAGTAPPSVPIPASWLEDRYDLVWVLTATGEDGAWSFVQVPQLLLAGDRAVDA
jgi:hypothetical protein